MKLKYKFAIQSLGKDYAAVAVGKDAAKFNGMLRFNEVGKTIFETLQKGADNDDIIAALKKEYQGDEADMRRETEKIVSQLKSGGLLID